MGKIDTVVILGETEMGAHAPGVGPILGLRIDGAKVYATRSNGS